MREKELTGSQKAYIRSVIDVLQYSTDLTLPYMPESEELSMEDASVGNAVVALVFYTLVKKENNGSVTGLDRKDIRKLSGTVINNSPGSRNLYDLDHGFNHSTPGYSRLGRNHSNKVRAGR